MCEKHKLGDICDILNGRNQKKVEDINGKYPIYGSGGIMGYANDYICKAGTTIIGRKGSINKPLYVDTEFWNVDTAFGLQPKECCHSRFLYYLCKSIDFTRYDKGVTIPSLVKSDLLQIPVSIPKLEEQSRIVEELDLLSNIIEKKRQQLSELDNLAQSIFYDMFGYPENSIYEVFRLADLTKNKMSYGSGASAIQYNGNIRYIRITDIKEDGTLSDEKMSPNVVDDKYMLCEGDILFARSGATVGKTYLYSEKDGMSIYAGYLIRFVANTNIVIPKYIFYYTRTTYYKAFIAASAQAVAQPNINAQQYGNLKVCVPPLSLQELFAKKIEAIEMEKAIIKQSISEIENLYDCKMTFYFN